MMSMAQKMPDPRRQAARTCRADGPDPVDLHVGKRLALRRTIAGLTQDKLAQAIGVTFQQIQKYERGANRVSASRLYGIARVLQVPVGYFFEDFEDDEDPAVSPPGGAPDGASGAPGAEEVMTKSETLELVRAYWRLPQKLRKLVREFLVELRPR
jgi:transcriptional regulator with XRE-family HTH domain